MEIGFATSLNYKETLIRQGTTDIVSLHVGSNGYTYVLDLIVFTPMYYCYVLSEENIQNFLKTKKKEYMLPNEDQQVYIITKNKKDVWEVRDIKKPSDCDLYFYEDEEDEEIFS